LRYRPEVLAGEVVGLSIDGHLIVARFSCRWPTVSRPMKILVAAGVLSVAKQGRERLYRLEKNSLNAARYWFTSFDA